MRLVVDIFVIDKLITALYESGVRFKVSVPTEYGAINISSDSDVNEVLQSVPHNKVGVIYSLEIQTKSPENKLLRLLYE